MVDGGFIDNFGALTVSDALLRLDPLIADEPEATRPRLVVIQKPVTRIAGSPSPPGRQR